MCLTGHKKYKLIKTLVSNFFYCIHFKERKIFEDTLPLQYIYISLKLKYIME